MGKKVILVILFLLVAFCLRFSRLDSFPISLFADEVDVGDQAYSILKTGKDYFGNPWPVDFQSYGDWRTPFFIYSSIPAVAIFGLNELGVRFTPAFFGLLGVMAIFFLVREMFKDFKIAFFSLIFLTFSFWHLHYSRAAFEVTEMLFLYFLALFFFFKSFNNQKLIFLSAFFIGLTSYVYNAPKLFTPLLIILMVIIYRQELLRFSKKILLITLVFFVILETPFLLSLISGTGGSRFSSLSIFTEPTVIPEIGFRRLEDIMAVTGEYPPIGTPPIFSSRVFHNKFLSTGLVFLNNYLEAFSTRFLFTFGDIKLRHSSQMMGVLFWVDIILIPLGLFWLFTKNKNRKLAWFLLFWLLIAPISSALTRDGKDHATRLILMLPPLVIFSSLGVNLLYNSRKKWILVVLSVVFLGQFILYWHDYYVHYPVRSERWWHWGFKETMLKTKEIEGDYERIVFSDRGDPPERFFLFWFQFDPSAWQKGQEMVDLNPCLTDLKKIDKYYFGHIQENCLSKWDLSGILDKKTLYVFPASELGGINFANEAMITGGELLESIYFPYTQEPAFYVIKGIEESL